jgi:hypothetical protein
MSERVETWPPEHREHGPLEHLEHQGVPIVFRVKLLILLQGTPGTPGTPEKTEPRGTPAIEGVSAAGEPDGGMAFGTTSRAHARTRARAREAITMDIFIIITPRGDGRYLAVVDGLRRGCLQHHFWLQRANWSL